MKANTQRKRRDFNEEIGVSSLLYAEIEAAVMDVRYFQRRGYLDGLDIVVKKWPVTRAGYPMPLQSYYRGVHHLKELVSFFKCGWASRMLSCLHSEIDAEVMMSKLKFARGA